MTPIRDRRAGQYQHMIRSVADLKRHTAASRGSGSRRRAMGRAGLHERQVRQLASRAHDWQGAEGRNEAGAHNIVHFQKRIAREDVSLTHTIIHPTIDKSTDGQFAGNRVPVHKTGDTAAGIVVRGARILATLAPFADEIAVYPAHTLPAGAEAYAGVLDQGRHAGLIFQCRDSARHPGRGCLRPAARCGSTAGRVRDSTTSDPARPALCDGHLDVQHGGQDRAARQHDEPDHDSRADEARVRLCRARPPMADTLGGRYPRPTRCWASCRTTSKSRGTR